MKYAYKQEEDKLITFKTYLLTEAKIAETTAKDYVKRIITLCKEEEMDLDAFKENIERLAYDYTEGSKQDLGKRSHNSYRSAILQFQRFVNQGGTINSTSQQPTYHFDINKVPGEKFGVIKLYDADNNLLDTQTTLDLHHHTRSEVARNIAEKCIKMMFDNVYNKDLSKLYEVLRILDCSLTVDGKNIIL